VTSQTSEIWGVRLFVIFVLWAFSWYYSLNFFHKYSGDEIIKLLTLNENNCASSAASDFRNISAFWKISKLSLFLHLVRTTLVEGEYGAEIK
jgi:hypothetical protein